ncbi:hypothetical protein L0128_15565 [candidate division KSB1 bacterium]|nr:hypothetical protein [candidate division KSB1 bacterium]
MSTAKSKKKRPPEPRALPAPPTVNSVQTQSGLKIEINREAQNYRMHFQLLPTGESESVTGLNADGVLDLIYHQLAQLAGHSPALPPPVASAPGLALPPKMEGSLTTEVRPAPSGKPASRSAEIIHEIQIYQPASRFTSGDDLQSQFPVTVALQVHLPVVPTAENIDIDTPGFGIRLQLAGAELTRPLIHDGCEDIHLGVSDYHRDCILPPLEPGEYVLAAWVTVPFARVREKRSVAFRVQAARSTFLTSKLN